MTSAPRDDPWIYHITHLDNLPSILAEGGLCSDVEARRRLAPTNIGHLHIKDRRLRRQVSVAAGGVLGDYVPFNFCPRSVMLCAVNYGHGDYRGGQDRVIHLVSRVSAAVATGQPWAFTDRHAELAYAAYFDDLDDLDEVPWGVMPLKYWKEVKEERQAEFLVHQRLPWEAIVRIGVRTSAVADAVRSLLADHAHQPALEVQPKWYY